MQGEGNRAVGSIDGDVVDALAFRTAQHVFTAGIRALALTDRAAAIAFGEQHLGELNDKRAVNTLVKLHKRAGNYARALQLLERLEVDERFELPLLAEVDGQPAGLAWGRIDADRRETAHLYQMWVDPAFRTCGAGDRLVAAVVDWARRCEAREVLLGVTRGNGAANRLYRRAGFVPIGEEPLRAGSPLMVDNMRLDLG